MKYLLLILSILFFIDLAHAEWFCSSVSTEKNGNTYLSCGIGQGPDEAEARANALIVAKTEFKAVCVGSSDCEGREVSIQPERTTCIKKDEGYSCHRMVIFTVGEPKDEKKLEESKSEPKPFSALEMMDKPVLKIGMTKQDLLKFFGAPDAVHRRILDKGEFQFIFLGKKFCTFNRSCSVVVKNDKVIHQESFKPEYTEVLQ